MTLALRPIRLVSLAAFSTWLALTALAYRQIPALEYSWAGNLLEYLPDWAGFSIALVALLVTTEEARGGLVRMASAVGSVFARLPQPLLDLALFALAAWALWLLRERATFANSDLLLTLLASDPPALFPGGGAPWVLRSLVRTLSSLGFGARESVQLVNCAFGAAAIVLVARAARALGDAPAYRIVPLFVFSAGLLRAIGGRVDVQPMFFAAAALCLALALENLKGRGHLATTSLAFGVTAALDPLGRFLLPCLAALVWLAGGARPGKRRANMLWLGLALVPLILQGVLLLATGGSEPDGGRILAASLGRGATGFIRLSGRTIANTEYVLFSARHLKYLANVLLLLAPAAIPLLFGFAVLRRGRIARTPAARWLGFACCSLAVGSCLLRPTFAFFDWEMLGVTALFLAFFAGSLVAEIEAPGLRGQLAAAVIGLQLLFFALPLSALALFPAEAAGPFAERAFRTWAPLESRRAPPKVAPWL